MRVFCGKAILQEEYSIMCILHAAASSYFVQPYAFATSADSALNNENPMERSVAELQTQVVNKTRICWVEETVDMEIAVQAPIYYGIVMQKGTETLEDFLRENLHISRNERIAIIYRVLQMIFQAHDTNIILMDMKPENILRFPQTDQISCTSNIDEWKGIDFDNSKKKGDTVNVNLTPSYACYEMASYVLQTNRTAEHLIPIAAEEMDICTFGWIALRVWLGMTFWQWKGVSNRILHHLSVLDSHTLQGDLDLIFTEKEDIEMKNIITNCLSLEPISRSTARELLNRLELFY
jgi:serine/threonine protein kinase